MTTFEPLTMQRAIRDDAALTTHQKALLWAAVLRADNETSKGKVAGQVRASLTLLARDADLSREWVTRHVKDSPEVLRYFANVKRRGRRTDLFLHVTEDHKRGAAGSPDVRAHVTEDHKHVTEDHKASDRGSHHLPIPAGTPATLSARAEAAAADASAESTETDDTAARGREFREQVRARRARRQPAA
jgi:hypothetical protein